jgi:hypothetical protein
MKQAVTTRNPTPLAFGIALPLALLTATACAWVLVNYRHSMKIAWCSWFGVFVSSYGLFLTTVNTKRFLFNETTRRIEVADRWLVVFEGRRTEYSFDEVLEIGMRTNEISDVVIVLKSGKKLNPKTGKPSTVRKLCEQIAEVMGKSQVFPGRWA